MAITTANTEAAPVVVPPSGLLWVVFPCISIVSTNTTESRSYVFVHLSDGNDGPWSTFDIHVGTPPQPLRVLVSLNAGEIWVISANKTEGGCLATDPPGCGQARGGLFTTNLSTTWQNKGDYDLDIEQNLNGNLYNGDYGLDAVGLGLADSGGIRLDSQTIAALSTKDPYLGYLGVNNHGTNFTSLANGEVGFLESRKSTGNIPSLSYAYSAGAQYRKSFTSSLQSKLSCTRKRHSRDIDFGRI